MGGKTNIKQRLTYIDIARAIGILFVVLGHINQFYRDSQGIEYSQILIFIYAFHMPPVSYTHLTLPTKLEV